MLRNQAHALIQHERIETTVPKAKELRPFVERIITHGQAQPRRAGQRTQGAARAPRWSLRDIQDRDVVSKLFDTIAPRFAERPGGYTRLLRLGYRRGDSAEVAQVELVGSEYDPNAETEKAKARRSRRRRASAAGCARRPSGCAARQGRGDEAEGRRARRRRRPSPSARDDGKGGKTDTRGKGAKTSSPRKAGGS